MQQGIDPRQSMLLAEQWKMDDRKMSHHPISSVEAKKKKTHQKRFDATICVDADSFVAGLIKHHRNAFIMGVHLHLLKLITHPLR